MPEIGRNLPDNILNERFSILRRDLTLVSPGNIRERILDLILETQSGRITPQEVRLLVDGKPIPPGSRSSEMFRRVPPPSGKLGLLLADILDYIYNDEAWMVGGLKTESIDNLRGQVQAFNQESS